MFPGLRETEMISRWPIQRSDSGGACSARAAEQFGALPSGDRTAGLFARLQPRPPPAAYPRRRYESRVQPGGRRDIRGDGAVKKAGQPGARVNTVARADAMRRVILALRCGRTRSPTLRLRVGLPVTHTATLHVMFASMDELCSAPPAILTGGAKASAGAPDANHPADAAAASFRLIRDRAANSEQPADELTNTVS